ncbi:cob(I)yrinic acid a,c-diamide adenosyltransferase [Thermophagus sp. OGC60D27]|uniref:cob(I)yrinic acid a,c-diamide adenosyltransferase n=1 Tax=Thermophagus sp. OGC60D27 TaxID=3458415 RepID=UPI004037FC21
MIHIYTGNGKGKTTAAIGLAVRSAGAGKKVFFGQFVKDMAYNEVALIRRQIPQIEHELFGRGCFFGRKPEQEDYDAARNGLDKIKKITHSGDYQLIIMDELNIAIQYNLLTVEEILSFLDSVPPDTEVVITGRNARQELIDRADLVTEMKEIKHYFNEGITSREGIEY